MPVTYYITLPISDYLLVGLRYYRQGSHQHHHHPDVRVHRKARGKIEIIYRT